MSKQIGRRNFLFGTVAATAAAGALTILGKGEDVQLFQPTLDEIVTLTRTPMIVPTGTRPSYDPIGPGDTLFNAKGKAVALVTAISAEIEAIDTTSISSDWSRYSPGRKLISIEVEYIGGPISVQERTRRA